MMGTLEEAEKLQQRCEELQRKANYPVPQVRIQREVRYFATYNNYTYALVNDWSTELLDEELRELRSNKANKDAPYKGGE